MPRGAYFRFVPSNLLVIIGLNMVQSVELLFMYPLGSYIDFYKNHSSETC